MTVERGIDLWEYFNMRRITGVCDLNPEQLLPAMGFPSEERKGR
jgi:hypothetical protein